VDRMLQSVLIGVAVIFVISLLKSSLRFWNHLKHLIMYREHLIPDFDYQKCLKILIQYELSTKSLKSFIYHTV
jgi:hypothetical protein